MKGVVALVKIGDALKKAVEVSPPKDKDTKKSKRISSTLMNFNRRRIFQLLCQRPCLVLNDIALTLEISRATVSWHLKTLVDNDYVEIYKVYGKDRYSPRGMLQIGEPALIISLLNDYRCGPLYNIIKESPGHDSKDLGVLTDNKYSVATCLKKLEETGLVSAVKDGRHIRYFPTKKISEIAKYERSRVKGFQTILLKRLEAEHLNPEIKDMKGGNLVIILRALGESEKLELPHNVVETALASFS